LTKSFILDFPFTIVEAPLPVTGWILAAVIFSHGSRVTRDERAAMKKKYTEPLHASVTTPDEMTARVVLYAMQAGYSPRAALLALNIRVWRGYRCASKKKRAEAGAMAAKTSKEIEADMRWLIDKATPLEWREVAKMMAFIDGLEAGDGSIKQNKFHKVLLQAWHAARKKKGKDWKYTDVWAEYDKLRALPGNGDLPEIKSKTDTWPLRRVLDHLFL
jgi:hypothetical protein